MSPARCHQWELRCRAAAAVCLIALVGGTACSGTSSDGSSDAGGPGDGAVGLDAGPVPSDGGAPVDGGVDAGPGTIAQVYRLEYLGSNGMPVAKTTDATLRNCWGLSIGETSPLGVASRNSGVVGSFSADGMPLGAPIALAKTTVDQHPTGIAFNGERSFLGDDGIVATDEGQIQGWKNGAVTVRVDRSANGARYKALAIARTSAGDRLYATNFAAGVVEIFDGSYGPISTFTDTSLPAGFAPFNVALIDGSLYVTFAKKNGGGTEAVAGAGNGYVEIFDTDGRFVRQVLAGGVLNAPFGVVHTPRDFGRFSDVLLVANLGDDRIRAFDPVRGDLLGELEIPGFQPLRIEGVHDLKMGNDNAGGPHNVLFFTAGPNGGANGAFGSITPTN